MPIKKKILSVLLTLIITCSFTVPSLASTSPTVTRLAGQTRYDTASAIAKQGWTQSDYVILAYGENYPDALAATPLAKKYNAPILLTAPSGLPTSTKQTLIDLQTKNVMIIGGTGVISSSVDVELQSMNINATRIFGNDKYETSIKIAQQITTTPSAIFVCTGEDFADGLSVSPIASIKQMPIILVPNDSIPDSVKGYISSNSSISKSYVIGYSDEINDNVANQFPNPERILGSDRYGRNVAINQKFNSEFNPDNICLASGEGFADALTGSAYAAKISEPIILVNNASPDSTKNYYQQRLPNANSVCVFGGTAVVSDSVVQGLGNASTSPIPVIPSPPVPTIPTPTPTETETIPPTPSSSTNPYPLNALQTVIVKDFLNDYSAQVTVKQIIRGQQAWTMIHEVNMFNSSPKSGYEYVLAKINFKLLDIADGKAFDLIGNVAFKLVSQDGKVYDFCAIVNPDTNLNSTLYKGASNEGWAAFLVKTDDIKPVLSYGTSYDGSGGIWFKAYNN